MSSPCSLFPSGTGLQSWSPGDTIYGVLGGGTERGTSPINLCTPVWERFKKISRFWSPFGSILGTNKVPTWLQKSIKIGPKSMPRYLPMLTSFFDRFLIDFYSQLRPPEPTKSLKSLQFYSIFLFSSHFKIRSILGTLRVPSWLHFPSKNLQKFVQNSILKGIMFLIVFCIDF